LYFLHYLLKNRQTINTVMLCVIMLRNEIFFKCESSSLLD